LSIRSPVGKPVVYQVFTRLFGNKNRTNKPWGTIERKRGTARFDLQIPGELIARWQLADGQYQMIDVLSDESYDLVISGGKGTIEVTLAALESRVILLQAQL